MDTNIILIGPSGAGKTTQAKLLSQRLDLLMLDLDDIRWDYYAEIGYDHDAAERIREEQGFEAFFAIGSRSRSTASSACFRIIRRAT